MSKAANDAVLVVWPLRAMMEIQLAERELAKIRKSLAEGRPMYNEKELFALVQKKIRKAQQICEKNGWGCGQG